MDSIQANYTGTFSSHLDLSNIACIPTFAHPLLFSCYYLNALYFPVMWYFRRGTIENLLWHIRPRRRRWIGFYRGYLYNPICYHILPCNSACQSSYTLLYNVLPRYSTGCLKIFSFVLLGRFGRFWPRWQPGQRFY
jgi:hypothetical protein